MNRENRLKLTRDMCVYACTYDRLTLTHSWPAGELAGSWMDDVLRRIIRAALNSQQTDRRTAPAEPIRPDSLPQVIYHQPSGEAAVTPLGHGAVTRCPCMAGWAVVVGGGGGGV